MLLPRVDRGLHPAALDEERVADRHVELHRFLVGALGVGLGLDADAITGEEHEEIVEVVAMRVRALPRRELHLPHTYTVVLERHAAADTTKFTLGHADHHG